MALTTKDLIDALRFATTQCALRAYNTGAPFDLVLAEELATAYATYQPDVIGPYATDWRAVRDAVRELYYNHPHDKELWRKDQSIRLNSNHPPLVLEIKKVGSD